MFQSFSKFQLVAGSPLGAWLSPTHALLPLSPKTPGEASPGGFSSHSPKRRAFLEPETSQVQILQVGENKKRRNNNKRQEMGLKHKKKDVETQFWMIVEESTNKKSESDLTFVCLVSFFGLMGIECLLMFCFDGWWISKSTSQVGNQMLFVCHQIYDAFKRRLAAVCGNCRRWRDATQFFCNTNFSSRWKYGQCQDFELGQPGKKKTTFDCLQRNRSSHPIFVATFFHCFPAELAIRSSHPAVGILSLEMIGWSPTWKTGGWWTQQIKSEDSVG